jgi:hypothetical protein
MSSAIGSVNALTRPFATEPVRPVREEPSAPGVVPMKRTALTGTQAARALEEAWTKKFGTRPSKETLEVLTSQWAHETGRGSHMYNFNFGGIKGTGPSGLSVSSRTKEGYGDTERTITDRFRAYRTAEEGASDYIELMAKRFPKALDAAGNGDPAGFVRALKSRGYFTGDERVYTRSVTSLTKLASEKGFDALGDATVPAPRVLDMQPVRGFAGENAEASELALASLSEEMPFVSAMAIADEVSRSAMRILADSSRRSEDV